MKAFLEIAGAGLTLLGVVAGVYGTFVLTQWSHPYKWDDFIQSILWMPFHPPERKNRINQVAAALAKIQDENKAVSLSGLQWIFIGFVLQTIGSILLTLDAVFVNFVWEAAKKTSGQ